MSPYFRDLLKLIPGYDPFASIGDAWFDGDSAQKAIDFFPNCLQHIEGALHGKPFVLERWQQAVLACLFGFYRIDGEGRTVRRFREVLIYVARKNGKTPFVAGIALYVLFCDEELGQQNYIAAADREQAGMLFRQAKGMVELEPELAKRCEIYGGNASAGQSRSVVREDCNSFLRVVSADADTKHGGNSHFIAIDELHAQPNRELVDVLLTSTASLNRSQTIIVYLTTADFHRESICNEKHEYGCKVRDGIIDDQAFLPVIFEAERDDDWRDPKVWAKANPNLGVSVSLEYLTRECKRAQETPAYENTFRRLHLNQKTETDTRAIPMDRWRSIDIVVDPIALEGRECYGGLDLASTVDIAAFVLVFPRDDGYSLLPWFWVPSENARNRSRKDRVDYDLWIKQGFITATPGNVIDYKLIRQDIIERGRRFNIREIAVDRWNATQLVTQLQGDGLEIVYYGQGYRDMTAPTKELLRLVAAGRLEHGNNPVLTWMASNTATESDAAGNLKPAKHKSTEKIDGIVATIMALGRAMISPKSQFFEVEWL